MRHVNLKFIGRDLLIGLITASFVYAPNAFAKPNNRARKKAVPYEQMLKLAKKSGQTSMSELSDAAKPVFKRRGYKLFSKDLMRSWDTKIDKMVIGRNYFKFKSEGRVYFGRYVDRGPVAFILNNKPILWKDVLFYNNLRSRIYNITTGKKLRKVSYLEDFLSYFTKEVYGDGGTVPSDGTDGKTPPADDDVTPIIVTAPAAVDTPATPSTPRSSGGTACITLEEMNRFNQSKTTKINGTTCPSKLRKECPIPDGFRGGGINVLCSKEFSECATTSGINFIDGSADPACDPNNGNCAFGGYKRASLTACSNIPPVAEDKKVNWAVIGAIGLLFLILLLKKKKKRSKKVVEPETPTPPEEPEPPVPPYVAGGESTCPPVGSRGITQEERDKLPGCNKSNCVDNGTCVGSKGNTVD